MTGRVLPQKGGLERLVEAWPDLPEAIRAGIVAMVRAACSWRLRRYYWDTTSQLPRTLVMSAKLTTLSPLASPGPVPAP